MRKNPSKTRRQDAWHALDNMLYLLQADRRRQQRVSRPGETLAAAAESETTMLLGFFTRLFGQRETINRGYVYLLHFERPISDKHTCQHYVGWAKYLPSRIAAHLSGHGARLTQVAIERGIAFTVARVWEGDRYLERKIKNRKHGPRYCPICNGEHEQQLAALDDLI